MLQAISRRLLLVSLALAASAALAQESPQVQRDAERARIATERQTLYKLQSEQETACYQRFAVEDCLRNVRSQVRAKDNALRRQEWEINSAERREKSQDKLRVSAPQESGGKAQLNGKPRSDAARSDGSTADEKARAQALRAQQARERAQTQSQRQQSQAAELARKQEHENERRAAARERYAAKQRSAQEHRQRQLEKMADKPKAAPLAP